MINQELLCIIDLNEMITEEGLSERDIVRSESDNFVWCSDTKGKILVATT